MVMGFLNILKDVFWRLPISDKEKENMYFFLKGRIKGRMQGDFDANTLKQYVEELLEQQNLSNSFSINYPTKKFISLNENDPKLIAYYLPQYYPDSHNEKWWGRGSTEWTNVSKSFPQYLGQYQPRLPGELGHYDLRIMDTIYRQIELAKFYGIYGFCFYYYWFDGVRLLDLPVTNFINDSSIDFPFSICWCNESWTKQWEGASDVPLMVQNPSEESYMAFIESCVDLFVHDNYIKVKGRPILTIYRPHKIPHPDKVISYWKKYVKDKTGLDLYLIASISTANKNDYFCDYVGMGFDACSEFAPGPHRFLMNNITKKKKYVCNTFTGGVYDYKDFVLQKKYFKLKREHLYRAVTPMWDNTPRRKNRSTIFDGATPNLYKQWLSDIILETNKNTTIEDKIILINAWNEWAEGAYLEPDLKWQYGYLEATRDAILECRNNKENKV
jgi:lipopolysaccharide biosynthesis protein